MCCVAVDGARGCTITHKHNHTGVVVVLLVRMPCLHHKLELTAHTFRIACAIGVNQRASKIT